MSETAPTAEVRPTSLAPLYVASMICSMGLMGFVTLAGPLADRIELAPWEIGLTMMAGGIGWVLAARGWGRAADRIGRKPVLMIGLFGFTLAFGALCLAAQAGLAGWLTPLAALAALIVARFSMGLTYAAIPAAGAAVIADHFPPEVRAGAMGQLGAAQSSGLVLGPAAVTLLAGISPALVLVLLALMPLPVLVYVHLRLPANRPRSDGPATQLALSDPRLRLPVLAAFTAFIAVGIAQIVIGFVALDRFGLDHDPAVRVAGLSLTAVGVVLVVAQLAVKRLGWPPARLMVTGGILSSAGFALAVVAPAPWVLIASYALAGFGAGWVFPAISTAVANAVEADEQGRAAGTVSASMGVGAIVAPLLGGALYEVAGFVPFLVAAAAMLLIAGMAVWRGAPVAVP